MKSKGKGSRRAWGHAKEAKEDRAGQKGADSAQRGHLRSEGRWALGRTRSLEVSGALGGREVQKSRKETPGAWCHLRGAKVIKECLQQQMGKGIRLLLHPGQLPEPTGNARDAVTATDRAELQAGDSRSQTAHQLLPD